MNGYGFGTITLIWDSPHSKGVLKPYEHGAPGEIRTPDLVVRSHALFFAFTPVIIELFYNGYPTVSGDWASYGPLNVVTIGFCGIKVGQQ